MQNINIDDLTKRLIPLTYLRRNTGEVLDKLRIEGELLLTKDGRPVAKLSSLEAVSEKRDVATDIKKIRQLAGGFHLGKITPKQINRIIEKSYEKMLSR